MTAPSEPVRPADEETVRALRRVLFDPGSVTPRRPSNFQPLVYEPLPHWYARAVVASEPWQRLVRERDAANAGLDNAIGGWDGDAERLEAERDQAIRERDEARAAVARVEAVLDIYARQGGLEIELWANVAQLRAALSEESAS